jgi:uncharacterized C2H2 Zn-finger protein
MLKAIKHFLKVVRMNFCRHRFVLMDNDYNRVSRRIGCGRLWYKCPKCGKVFYADIDTSRHRDYYHGWHEVLKNKM